MLMSIPKNSRTEIVQEVEIGYTEQSLLTKLSKQALKPSTLLSALRVNIALLTLVEHSTQSEASSYLFQLCDALKNWQPSASFKDFTGVMNQLIFLWLNAIQDGTRTQAILDYLSCFEIKSSFGINHSSKLHCFLFDLVAETMQEQHQHQLDYVLNFDANTQLPNANQLLLDLEKINENAHDNQLSSVFSLHFQVAKNNPIFLHTIAMGLSKKITSALLQNLPPENRLYFSGNLQFDILIPNVKNKVQLNLLAAKLTRTFEELIFLGNQSILVTPYIGCTLLENNSEKMQDILACSSLALESALASKQNFVIYSEALQTKLSTQNELEKRVLDAFASDSLTLYFQPIVDLDTEICVGAELLLRWSEKMGQSVHPSLTVEILNKVGKGKLFTRWLINSAYRYASELLNEQQLNVYLTLNLRAEDLYDVELPHLLLQALALWKIEPKDVILEVTENGILELNETTNSVIMQLAENGFKLALDDFGTGFSSLSRLRTMPIDLIKIDQSFVRNIKHSQNDFEIVNSIAMLAYSLGKEVLAEGVEDADCLELIKRMKINKCQGYYFAKPMPFEQFIVWAKQHGA